MEGQAFNRMGLPSKEEIERAEQKEEAVVAPGSPRRRRSKEKSRSRSGSGSGQATLENGRMESQLATGLGSPKEQNDEAKRAYV